jgi:hypothetical protein
MSSLLKPVFVGPSGGVVLLLLDAAGAAGSPLHGVGGGVQRGAGRRLIAGSVVDQVLQIQKYLVYKIMFHTFKFKKKEKACIYCI